MTTDLAPLTAHARDELASLRRDPRPRQEFNPGVAARLERGELVETVLMPSPYATGRGKDIQFLRITYAGLAELDKAP